VLGVVNLFLRLLQRDAIKEHGGLHRLVSVEESNVLLGALAAILKQLEAPDC